MTDRHMNADLPFMPAPYARARFKSADNTAEKTFEGKTPTLEELDQSNYESYSFFDPIPSWKQPEPESMEVEKDYRSFPSWQQDDVEEGRQSQPDTAPLEIASTTTTTTKLVRCRYWPECLQGESCLYHHPTKQCIKFPNCTYGTRCLFIHPTCKYDGVCTRTNCAFTHARKRDIPPSSGKSYGPSSIKCRFFPKCTNQSCPFLHPKVCHSGPFCKTYGCSFHHPHIPTRPQLKWIAPETSSTSTNAAFNTTAANDSIVASLPSICDAETEAYLEPYLNRRVTEAEKEAILEPYRNHPDVVDPQQIRAQQIAQQLLRAHPQQLSAYPQQLSANSQQLKVDLNNQILIQNINIVQGPH